MEQIHPLTTNLLKFLAQHPFEEIMLDADHSSQILIINYATQEVTLRDFCEYSVWEIVSKSLGFKNPEIDKEWKKLIESLK